METARKVSYTRFDYDALPEGAPFQLIAGKFVMSPSPTPFHQIVLQNICFALERYVRKHHPGILLVAPLDVYLSDIDIFQPDLVYITAERTGIITPTRIEGAPDFVVEVLSLSTARYDLEIKKDTYAKAGVQEYWIVAPASRRVDRYLRRGQHLELASRHQAAGPIPVHCITGFSISREEVFNRGLLPSED